MSEQNGSAPVDNTSAPAESQEQKASSVVTPEQKPQATGGAKKFKLKIDGQEFEEEFDPSNEQELVKHLQLSKVAQKRMQEAAQYRKNYEEAESIIESFLEQLKADPLSVLKNQELELGVNLDEIYEKLRQEQEERSKKTPEQLELEKYRSEIEKLQREKQEAEEAKLRQEQERINKEAAEYLEKSVADAIENGDLPKSKYITHKMMDLAHIAYANGINIPIEELIPVAKKMYIEDMRDMLGKQSDEVVEELLTQDRIKRIRGKRIAELRKTSIPKVDAKDVGVTDSTKKDEKKPIKTSDFFKNLGV